MDIERVQLCTELLRKSSHVDFCINKGVYEYNNIQEIVEKIEKQYGLIVNVHILNKEVIVVIEVEQ